MKGDLRKNFLVAGAATLFALLLGEAALRVLDYPPSLRPPRRESGRWSSLVHGASSIPGLDYELRRTDELPGETSLLGLRDTLTSITKPDSVRRVLCLGDSQTYGLGVALLETYPKRLEAKLCREGLPWQVVNMGVSGYSSADEAVLLAHRAEEYRPDLVVIGYSLNDPETEPLQALHSAFCDHPPWHHVHLCRLLAAARRRLEVRRYGGYVQYLHRCPARWESVVRAFRSIGETCAAHHAPVIVVIIPIIPRGGPDAWEGYPQKAIHGQVAAEAVRNGFRVVDLLPDFRRYPGDRLRVSPADGHPSPFGHDRIAEALAESIARLSPDRENP